MATYDYADPDQLFHPPLTAAEIETIYSGLKDLADYTDQAAKHADSEQDAKEWLDLAQTNRDLAAKLERWYADQPKTRITKSVVT